jgi:hypothetical protein
LINKTPCGEFHLKITVAFSCKSAIIHNTQLNDPRCGSKCGDPLSLL